MDGRRTAARRRLDEAASGPRPRYRLALYVAGASARSERAIANLRRLCEGRLAGRVDCEVIDIYQQVERAREADILGAPTLIKLLPQPVRRLIGDLSDEAAVLRALGLEPAGG